MKFIQITRHVRLFCTFYFSNKIVFTWRYLSFNEQVTFWTSINQVSVERVRSSLGVKVFVSAQQTPVEELQLSCEKNWCTWFSFASQITFISFKTMISEICHYLWRYDVCGCAWISYDLKDHLIFLVRAQAIDISRETFCCVVLLCIFKEFYRTSKITQRYYPPKRSFRTEKRKTEEAICDRSWAIGSWNMNLSNKASNVSKVNFICDPSANETEHEHYLRRFQNKRFLKCKYTN